MSIKLLKTIIIFGMVFVGSIPLANAVSFAQKKDNRTISISVGQANVKANEIVYCQPTSCTRDYKVSQLIWDVSNITMLNTGFGVRMSPSYTFSVNGRFAVKIGRAHV